MSNADDHTHTCDGTFAGGLFQAGLFGPGVANGSPEGMHFRWLHSKTSRNTLRCACRITRVNSNFHFFQKDLGRRQAAYSGKQWPCSGTHGVKHVVHSPLGGSKDGLEEHIEDCVRVERVKQMGFRFG